jgi:DNA replication initiation complex subunit (GINS family)
MKMPEDFEQSASMLISKMGEDSGKAPGAEPKREFENAQRLLSMLLRIRRQKVVFRALNEGQKHETVGMTVADHALFDRICGLVEEEDLRVAKIVGGGKTPPEEGARHRHNEDIRPIAAAAANAGEITTATEASNTLKRLRIIKEVKAYRSADGSTVGPFKIGDEVPLAAMEATLLVRGRLAEEI